MMDLSGLPLYVQELVRIRVGRATENYERDLGRRPSDKTIKEMREVVVANMLADGEVAE